MMWCWKCLYSSQLKALQNENVLSWCLLKQLMNVFRWQRVPCLWTCVRESSFSKLSMQTWQNIVCGVDRAKCIWHTYRAKGHCFHCNWIGNVWWLLLQMHCSLWCWSFVSLAGGDWRTEDRHRLCRVVVPASDAVGQFTVEGEAANCWDPHAGSVVSRSTDIATGLHRHVSDTHGTGERWIPALPLSL